MAAAVSGYRLLRRRPESDLESSKERRARLEALLIPLLAGCARGQVLDSRLYDRRLWRIVARFQ
jgi:hypothetical protein